MAKIVPLSPKMKIKDRSTCVNFNLLEYNFVKWKENFSRFYGIFVKFIWSFIGFSSVPLLFVSLFLAFVYFFFSLVSCLFLLKAATWNLTDLYTFFFYLELRVLFCFLLVCNFPVKLWWPNHNLYSEINRDWLPLSVADERWQTSWGGKKQTKSTLRNRRACSELQF